jgi:hypothetical protein
VTAANDDHIKFCGIKHWDLVYERHEPEERIALNYNDFFLTSNRPFDHRQKKACFT